ncbi:hypothetical protein [Helicobacter felis]|uniref:hypothetical protein n=1 Tax=Helicobacter felis TaxID=214 RepID=UPI002D764D93|nr:hypothetical protein [Helicobacter felis]
MIQKPIRATPAKAGKLWRACLSLEFQDELKPKKRELKAEFAHRGFTSFWHGEPLNIGLPPCGGVAILSFLFFPCAFSALLSGCVRVYKPVYVPTKCQIPKLERPALGSSSLAQNIKALLIYTELLEKDLDFCREGKLNTKEK